MGNEAAEARAREVLAKNLQRGTKARNAVEGGPDAYRMSAFSVRVDQAIVAMLEFAALAAAEDASKVQSAAAGYTEGAVGYNHAAPDTAGLSGGDAVERLLPCPFCGGRPFHERADYSSCYVICNDCSARGPVSCDENDADADASEAEEADPGELAAKRLWNTRAFPPVIAPGEEREKIARIIAPNGQFDCTHLAKADTILALAQLRQPDEGVERLSDILDTERYKVAISLQGIKRAIDGRRWLSEPGRGSYTYDDERYQAEFGQALNEIDEALKPLRRIAGDWSYCPRDPLRVAANRTAALATPTDDGEQRG